MDDWNYCVTTLPKVSRTFALNISVLKGDLHKSILVAYLFCRTIDTVEDAYKLDASLKIQLLLRFASILQDTKNRSAALDQWTKHASVVDGSPTDIDLLQKIRRVFNIFESLQENHKQQIISSVCTMAQGMAYFQKKINSEQITLLENTEELEEYRILHHQKYRSHHILLPIPLHSLQNPAQHPYQHAKYLLRDLRLCL